MRKVVFFLIVFTFALYPEITRDFSREIVIDSDTSLQWEDYPDRKKKEINWNDAKKYCNELYIGGYNDWRIPTVHELSTLVDRANEKLPVISRKFINTYTENYYYSFYWTTTKSYSKHWVVNLRNGGILPETGYYNCVKCVRGDFLSNDIDINKDIELSRNIANAKKILTGRWKDNNSISEYKADGTVYIKFTDRTTEIESVLLSYSLISDIYRDKCIKYKKRNSIWKTCNTKDSYLLSYISPNKYLMKLNENKMWWATRLSATAKEKNKLSRRACFQMSSIVQALKMFKLDNGMYPATEEGLKALLKNPDQDKYPNYSTSPYMETLPKDSWKTPFVYVQEGNKFDLISLGSDHKKGGEGDAADIHYLKCQQNKLGANKKIPEKKSHTSSADFEETPSPKTLSEQKAKTSSSKKEIQENKVTKVYTLMLDKWNGALNDHDISTLSLLYAENLTYYGKKRTKTFCLNDKEKALKKYPNFTQRINDIKYEKISDNIYRVTFIKKSRSKPSAKERRFSGYLLVDINKNKIIEEGDKTTDRNMGRNLTHVNNHTMQNKNGSNDSISTFLEAFVYSGTQDYYKKDVIRFYSSYVNPYYGIKHASIKDILQDKKRYFKRWPTRDYRLVNYQIVNQYIHQGHQYYDVLMTIAWKLYSPKIGKRTGNSTIAMTLIKKGKSYKITSTQSVNTAVVPKKNDYSGIDDDEADAGCDNPIFTAKSDSYFFENKTMALRIGYETRGKRIIMNVEATNKTRKELKGGVSISFYDIYSSKQISRLYRRDFDSLTPYPKGKKVWNKKLGKSVKASYLLVEAWAKRWRAGETKRASFSINVRGMTVLSVQIRGLLIDGRREFPLPDERIGVEDQQGYMITGIDIESFN